MTTGPGGYDRLDFRDVPIPVPMAGEALVKVLAAGINNTDINTRLGWYSSRVTAGTAEAAGAMPAADGGWNGASPFPFIQGTDCCGRVAAIGPGGDASLLGQRVLVRPCMRPQGFSSLDMKWLGSDFDGAFADYAVVPQAELFPIASQWSDAELATIPCAYGTAENMLHRAGVSAGERVLVTGASGGVGSAAVQLAKRRGAWVAAVTTADKAAALLHLGADHIIDRALGIPADLAGTFAVAVDNVAGPGFGGVLTALARGGCYVTSGAIAGPVVALDMRDLYLQDLTLIGCTAWDAPVFPNLIGYIERNEIRPLVAGTFPLQEIAEAQRAFLEKRHVGNFVLIPPGAA
ncbi:alcohol dehydrogenase catalytic domain-containing protein [Dongia rigui]|uniref:Zinc-binding dehydrogenase n=1 Tax=Dongia rigui TaxID=940149 RepID=A0ABU5DVG0_9PROT|nr:zinc-binding dehydrogenase [Dongia rigui]MDY0871292.1 zinc-binding dehydrogenase [Dongia rigui]